MEEDFNTGDKGKCIFVCIFFSNNVTEFDLLGCRESTTTFSVDYCNFLVNVTVKLFAFL